MIVNTRSVGPQPGLVCPLPEWSAARRGYCPFSMNMYIHRNGEGPSPAKKAGKRRTFDTVGRVGDRFW